MKIAVIVLATIQGLLAAWLAFNVLEQMEEKRQEKAFWSAPAPQVQWKDHGF